MANGWEYECLADGCDYTSVDAGAVLLHIQEEHEVRNSPESGGGE